MFNGALIKFLCTTLQTLSLSQTSFPCDRTLRLRIISSFGSQSTLECQGGTTEAQLFERDQLDDGEAAATRVQSAWIDRGQGQSKQES